MTHALILANGDPPGRKLFTKCLKSADIFICADGGANTASRYSAKPDLIIGDLDSISEDTLRKFKNVEVRKIENQNSTDLEKALSAAVKMHCTRITVLGAFGGRFDHSIGNISALSKFSKLAEIKFLNDTGEFIPVKRALKLDIALNTLVSLLPLTRCTGIITKGLKWNLKNESLQLGVREGTHNIVTSSPVTIKVRRGNLIAFIMREYKSEYDS